MAGQLKDAERLLTAAKLLVAEERKYAKLSDRALQPDLSSKQAQKANVDLNWQAFHIRKIESDVHAIAVDMGLADLREPGHYRPSSVRLSGWHEYMFHPALPASQAIPSAQGGAS